MKKLSELPMDTMLTVDMGDLEIMSKKDFIEDSDCFKDLFLNYNEEPFPEVTIAEKTVVVFDLSNVIDTISEQEETHDDWKHDVWHDIEGSPKEKTIKAAVSELNRIFGNNPTYWEGEPVEIDMNHEDEDGDPNER